MKFQENSSSSLTDVAVAKASPALRPPLTRQADLWGVDRAAHRQAVLSGQVDANREPSHRFELKDPLLRRLLLLGEPTPPGQPTLVAWPVGKLLGAALLTWFVQQALGIRRLPFCEDRLLSSVSRYERPSLLAVLEDLTPARVETILDEVRRLYAHTQEQLRLKGVGEVNLRRHIDELEPVSGDLGRAALHAGAQHRGQAGQFAQLRLAADALGRETVDLDMDTLNSWGDDGGYAYRAVHLYCTVPAADILLATELVGGAERGLESGEWIVINRSPTGVVSVPTHCLDVQGLDQERSLQMLTRHTPERVLAQYQPLVLRAGVSLGRTPDQGRPAFFASWSFRLRRAWRLLSTGEM